MTYNGYLDVDGVWFNSFPGEKSAAIGFLSNVLRKGAAFSNLMWGPTFRRKVRKVGDIRYEARSRGRSSPDSSVF